MSEPWLKHGWVLLSWKSNISSQFSDTGKLHLGSKSKLTGVPRRHCWRLVWCTCCYFYCPWHGSHCANVETWHSQYTWRICPPSLHPIQYIEWQLHGVSSLDLVCESYKDNSLKTATRRKIRKRVQRRVVSTAVIPVNWKSLILMCRCKHGWAIHLPVFNAGSILPKWDKGACYHWQWSSRLPSKIKK